MLRNKHRNVNDKLYHAAKDGDEALVRQCIGEGASKNWKYGDSFKYSALHQASKAGHTNVVKILLDAGWNMDAKTQAGYTPLYLAAEGRKLDTLKCLLLRGAKTDEKDSTLGYTPIHIASYHGHTDEVRFLLLCGANQGIKDFHGKTAIRVARNDKIRTVFREFNENQELMKTEKLKRDLKSKNWDSAATLIFKGVSLENDNTFEKLREIATKITIIDRDYNRILVSAGDDVADIHQEKLLHIFHLAIKYQHTKTSENLRNYFISNIEKQDEDGNTSLHLVANSDFENSLNSLLEIGATSQQFVKNKRGEIPLILAQHSEKMFRIILLDFLTFALKTSKFTEESFQRQLGGGKNLFCLKRDVGGRTLLQYIADHGMIKEREELLELLIKIDKFRNKGNFIEKESKKRIIKILRSGIKPSKGLKEAIDSLQNRYSWSYGRMIIMSIIFAVLNIGVGGSLYILDVYTDILGATEE